MKKIVIAHLYPREMNIYGDLGNIITLQKRLEWRGYEAEVRPVEIGAPFDFAEADIVFGGGGQDSGQLVVGDDLMKRGEELRRLADDGMPMLVICGMYQLFGRGFITMQGQDIPGINVFRLSTTGSQMRMIGNVVIESRFGQLVGFENHSGQTLLEPGQDSLGTVTKGYGNNSKSRHEGALSNNAIGTYLHGPVLPKNPRLADYLLQAALTRRYGEDELVHLGDERELAAVRVSASRPQ